MDIMLERILSLLPRKPDGKYVRGAKKDFAVSIGYDSGDIVSMWINGSSESYKGKLHEIAAKYDVSIVWLRGETDEKKPTVKDDGRSSMSEARKMLYDAVDDLTDEQCIKLLGIILEAKKIL